MLTKRLLLLLLLIVVIAVGLGVLHRQQTSRAAVPMAGPNLFPVARSSRLEGTASCAGRSCHGGLTPTDRATSWQTEYTHWLTRDPHERAYRVLLEPAAKEMALRLGIGGGNAHEATQCLACHVNPAVSVHTQDMTENDFLRRERSFGVGCESCHGTATRWLDAHLSVAWAKQDAAQKRALGLADLSDPATLVKTCAGCHVGAPPSDGVPGRDVNHDLIAAGHPRLAFEATSFFANLPRHWKAKPHEEVRLWATGQLVSAEAALELLKQRTSDGAPWPELAEYDCTGCHHGLGGSNWRQMEGRRGKLAWGTWYFAMPRGWLFAEPPLLGDGADLPKTNMIRELMERTMPSREAVQDKIPWAIEELQSLRKRMIPRYAADPGPKLSSFLLSHPPFSREIGWDALEQSYLALVAFNQVAKDDAWDRRLRLLESKRTWPPDARFDPREFFK